MKTCGRCHEDKSLADFASDTRRGHQHWCRTCTSAYRAGRRVDYLAHSKNWYSANRQSESEKQRLRKYGLSREDYYRLLEDQGFCCASCCDELQGGKHTHIDHCHETGRVRGVLCKPCNNALGFLNDEPARVELLASYARRVCA